MTDLDSLPWLDPDDTADQRLVVLERPPRKCRHPRDQRSRIEDGWACQCGHTVTRAAVLKGKNARKRGGAAELDVAKTLGARKVGPLGHPWDIEMTGYARLQVRKYLNPESLRKIAAELSRIGSGAEMPGYVWIQPGRGGERLIVFRLADYAERHGEGS